MSPKYNSLHMHSHDFHYHPTLLHALKHQLSFHSHLSYSSFFIDLFNYFFGGQLVRVYQSRRINDNYVIIIMLYSFYLNYNYLSNLHSNACSQCIKKVVGQIDKLKHGKEKIGVYDFVYVYFSHEFKKIGTNQCKLNHLCSKKYKKLNDFVCFSSI